MKLINIIKELKKLGHSVAYTHRKDGGYVIRRIDGISYAGKLGNQVARNLVGVKLSTAREVQLKRIRTPKGKRAVKRAKLPDILLKKLKRIQRLWRKEHPTIQGTASLRNVRYYYETYGEEKTILELEKSYRYAQGYAYIENVKWLIQRIDIDLSKNYNKEMKDVRDLIYSKMMVFREEWFSTIYYEAVYPWEQNKMSGEESARIIRNTIN